MKAATYPNKRVGCHNHALGAAGDAVVAGWAGLNHALGAAGDTVVAGWAGLTCGM